MAAPDPVQAPEAAPPPAERISRLAHDLANVLALIVARLSIFASQDLPAGAASEVSSLLSETNRAREMIRELLRAARGGPRERVSLLEIVRETVAGLDLEENGVRVEIDGETAVAEVIGRGEQLRQIVASVLETEQEALRGAGSEARLNVRVASRASGVCLTVKTNSSGFSDEERAALTGPFTLRKPPGWGSGLSFGVCAQIAREHGGSFSLLRPPEGGREYRLELPACLEPRAGAPAGPVPSRGAMGTPRGVILVVDDDAKVREAYDLMVRFLGYSTEGVGSGEQALRRLGENAYDAIILDLHLGGRVNGGDVLRETQRAHPELLPKIVLSTGDPQSRLVRRLAAELRIRVLAKPFGVDELRQAIDSSRSSRT